MQCLSLSLSLSFALLTRSFFFSLHLPPLRSSACRVFKHPEQTASYWTGLDFYKCIEVLVPSILFFLRFFFGTHRRDTLPTTACPCPCPGPYLLTSIVHFFSNTVVPLLSKHWHRHAHTHFIFFYLQQQRSHGRHVWAGQQLDDRLSVLSAR